ncbi:DUF5304 domain-containing protein [Sphaerisporangium fuscum]|uniref:DUF5304 domain-containing protein n=1 Tax=Sphaerisporangium fuscum TaxID=2835868 RepID=UPI001BDD9CE2|nr:DUF5304 domain-containing protein [Sphaerisporangium fuscum]
MTEMSDNSGVSENGRASDREEWFRRRDAERRAESERSDRRDDERASGGGPSREPGEGHDPLGAMAQEARKLFDSLQERVGRELGKGVVKGGVSGLGHGLGQVFGGGDRAAGDVWSEAVAGHDDDEYICRACPVCRLKAARREAGGDVTDHLIAAGGELLAAFRQAVDAVSRPAAPRRPGDTDTRVHHIDLG